MAEAEDLYNAMLERAKALPYYETAWPPKRDRRMQPVGLLPHRIELMGGHASTIGRHAAGAAPLADARLEALLRGWLALLGPPFAPDYHEDEEELLCVVACRDARKSSARPSCHPQHLAVIFPFPRLATPELLPLRGLPRGLTHSDSCC